MPETFEQREARVKEMASKIKVGDSVHLADLGLDAVCVESNGDDPKFRVTIDFPCTLELFNLVENPLILRLNNQQTSGAFVSFQNGQTLIVMTVDAYLRRIAEQISNKI